MDDKWFKKKQKEKGVTADEIAARMGRDRSAISHIYTGKRKMSFEWATAFSDVLGEPVSVILERAGVATAQEAQPLTPGFSDSDAVPWVGQGEEERKTGAVARSFGGGQPGIDVWSVRSDALLFDGFLPGDFVLLDTHKADRCAPGDYVVAQRYDAQNGTASTVLRRYEPPVLVASSPTFTEKRIDIVDGNNVLIRGKVVAQWRST